MGWTATGRMRAFARLVVCIGVVGLFARHAAAGQFGFVYALQQVNGGTNQIHGFSFDPGTGQLTLLPGFPMSSGGTGGPGILSEQLAYADGRLVVLNNGSDTMTVFNVNRSTGGLTPMPFNPVALGVGDWNCVAVRPGGSPVVAASSVGNISSFVVTSSTATAASGSPFVSGNSPFSCRFSQNGAYFYTGGNSGNTIAGFSVEPSSGVLTALAGSPFDAGALSVVGYATDASGRLFGATLSSPQVRAYTTAAGVPTGVSGNPFPSGLATGIHGLVHPAGFYMVADRTNNSVGSYQIAGTGAATTLTAVFGSPFASGGSVTNVLALSADGEHLLAANNNSRNITVFQVYQPTGIMSFAGIQAVNTLGASGGIAGLVFVESEVGFVYTIQQVNGAENQIHGFRIHPSTGALIPLAGFPVGSGGNGSYTSTSEEIAYGGGRLFVENAGSNNLSAFRVNRATGALTPLPFSPVAVPTYGGCVAVHPSGSPVVVGYENHLASFSVGASTMSPAAGSPYSMGPSTSAFSCHFTENGNYVYAGGGTRFAGFAVNAGTGVLTPLAGSPFESGGAFSSGYATDSSGSGRLFMTTFESVSKLRVFTTSSGVPTGVSGNPFAGGLLNGVDGVLHPSGYYMVADRNNPGFVGVYQIAGTGAATTLTPVSGSPFGTGGNYTDAVALTDDGRFLIAGNGLTLNLTVFRVNPDSGVLNLIGTQPTGTLGDNGLVTGVTFVPAAPGFIDDPLIAATGVIKAVHITELRARIDAARARYGIAPYGYIDPALPATSAVIRAAHIRDLRAALAEVYAASGIALPSYTDPVLTSGTTVVKAVHIMELRAAVVAIE